MQHNATHNHPEEIDDEEFPTEDECDNEVLWSFILYNTLQHTATHNHPEDIDDE